MANNRTGNDQCFVTEQMRDDAKRADYAFYPGAYYREGSSAGAPYMPGADCSDGNCGPMAPNRVRLDSLLTRGTGSFRSRCSSGDVNRLPENLQDEAEHKASVRSSSALRNDMLPLQEKYKKGAGPQPILSEIDMTAYNLAPNPYSGDYSGINPLGRDTDGYSFTLANSRDMDRQATKEHPNQCNGPVVASQGAYQFNQGTKGVASLFA